ncbi:MAG: hypothetical protein M3083_11530 [Actinomycetota bacterium]|nr:hypothetical protein [Actinomycetota bacterium]
MVDNALVAQLVEMLDRQVLDLDAGGLLGEGGVIDILAIEDCPGGADIHVAGLRNHLVVDARRTGSPQRMHPTQQVEGGAGRVRSGEDVESRSTRCHHHRASRWGRRTL